MSARRLAGGAVFAAFAIAFDTATLSSEPPSPAMPGPAAGADEARARGAAAANEACAGCHADIAAEWAGSHHRVAYTGAAFQRALAIEPLPFCRGCHAPEAPPSAPPPPELAAIGVACTSCHVAGGALLAAPRDGRSAAPHASLRAGAFASPAACAGCHEFDFPGAREAREPMQSTVTEHAASGYSETACAGCHMPLVDGADGRRHRSHAFASSRDPRARRRALSISTRRRAGGASIAIAPGEVGHAFPTGDLFRRLAVVAEVVGDDRALLASRARYLGRHYRPATPRDGHRVRVTAADDRPGAPARGGGAAEVDLDFGAIAAGRTIAVRVVYQRVAHVMDGREDEAAIESEEIVFERELSPANEEGR